MYCLRGRSGLHRGVLTILVIVGFLASCTVDDGTPVRSRPPRGGTLKVFDPGAMYVYPYGRLGLDPQDVATHYDELLRCCLLRTLMSYSGNPYEQGGSEARPDLAENVPVVSDDGLTWTFTIRSGIAYAPPMQDVEVTSRDFVRALERLARLHEAYVTPYFNVIDGFQAMADGEVNAISGLATPDTHTLVIRLTEPAGDLPYRLTFPAAAPIPPDAPAERLGTAQGHDGNYGRFLVASGPYMIEGSEDLDFALPPAQQNPVAGFVPARGTDLESLVTARPGSLTLVRNPSWQASTDPLRPAYVDRIEIVLGTEKKDSAWTYRGLVESGQFDVVLGQAPAQMVSRYLDHDGLRRLVHSIEGEAVWRVDFNLAVPPFDDVHVRKAVNLALNKARIAELSFGPSADVATHLMPDALQEGLLADYDPYATPGSAGNLRLGRSEMARSRYDSDGDGMCDVTACRRIPAVGVSDPNVEGVPGQIREDLLPLGLNLNIRVYPWDPMFARCLSPKRQTAVCLTLGWGSDYPDGGTFGAPLFSSRSIPIGSHVGWNSNLLGASDRRLKALGYSATDIPNVDERIEACDGMIGSSRSACWAGFDQYLMEEVVPWAPYEVSVRSVITSSRVVAFSFDQAFSGGIPIPSLDRVALATTAEPTHARGRATGSRPISIVD